MDENCIFCKIIAGKIPTLKVYEDKDVMAFLDIAPANKGHTLIVPKKHSKDMLEDNNKDLAAVMKAAKKISAAVMKAVSAEGFNFIANTGPVAGQVVFHTHFHIIPRFENDGLKHWPKKDYSEDEMIAVKNKIIESI
ncbi:TPA: HIT family protein [Candidatus Woesearchaeota archaeon]|nr:Histidine triad (HIT) protein [archaeon GW2011_AR15]MBS3104492.1 HIT family protein [Candidatus Woesearchaeota archaeon]HIH41194.1 HIT family protein [Candidatus Woesearchaeota archaeon]